MEEKPKVLLVDDEASIRELLRRVNNYFGFETIEASDGEEGWTVYMEIEPDLVVSDICMPKMNGVQLLANIRRYDEHAKVILITGHCYYRNLAKTWPYPPNGFLEKPFEIGELGRMMQELIGDTSSEHESETMDCPESVPLSCSPETTPENAACIPTLEHDD